MHTQLGGRVQYLLFGTIRSKSSKLTQTYYSYTQQHINAGAPGDTSQSYKAASKIHTMKLLLKYTQ